METTLLGLIVLYASGLSTSYVLKPYKYPYVVIANHEHCEERWYAPLTWITIENPTENDGEILGAYLGGFNSEFKPVPINLKARVSGEITENGNWTLQSIAFCIRGTMAKNPPFPYSTRIKVVKEPATIYCAQVPEDGKDTLYFKDVTVTTSHRENSGEESNMLYVIMDDPMQFLIKLQEKAEIASVYKTIKKRSIRKSEFFIPKLRF